MRPLPCNWRSRIQIVKETKTKKFCGIRRTDVFYSIEFVKGKTPKGCCQSIGYMYLCDDKNGTFFVDDVYLDSRFRNRGLGKMIYERALKDVRVLSTRYHAISDDARRVWRGLAKRHRHKYDFWTDELTVFA